MYPPSDVCRELARIHPQLRLAWEGRPAAYEGELNPGRFAVVQLYHNRDCGSYDDTHTYREFWDVTTREDPDSGFMVVQRINRGPIFAKDGSPHRDWDTLSRKAVFVATLDSNYQNYDGTPITNDDVMSGKILKTIKRWLTKIEKRQYASAVEKGRDHRRKTNDISDAITDRIWSEAKKSDADYTPISKKHQREDAGVKRMRARLEKNSDGSELFVPPMPKGST